MLEREVKFPVGPSFSLPDLALPGFAAVASQHRYVEAVYYDTEDLRLTRWGASLRHRTGEGWTVKLPPSGRTDLIERREVRFEGRWDRIPSPAEELVKSFVRRGRLVPIARLRTVRKPLVLVDAGGRRVAEVVEDRVSANHGPGPAECFREIEIELAEGADPAVLEPLIALLRQAGAGASSTVSKLGRALGTVALGAPDVVVPELGANPSGDLVVRAAIASSVVRFVTHMPGVHLDDDPEYLHQARVATRRLRSDLGTFLPLIDAEWAEPLREQLRWLGGTLGRVRDADVMLARLRGTAALLPDPESAAPFLEGVAAERTQALHRLLATLRGERYGRVLDALTDAAAAPVLLPGARRPAAETMVGMVSRPLRRLRAMVEGLPEEPADAALHRVRIRAKRLRYAAEVTAPVLGEKAVRLAGAAARLQDTLGELQDAVVAYEYLSARSNGQTGFTAGRLAGIELVRATRARAAWSKKWKRLDKKTPKAWR